MTSRFLTPLSHFAVHTSVALLSAATLVLSGCASTGAPATGTMSRYEQLKAQPDGVRSFRSPEAARYRFAEIDLADIQFAQGVRLAPEQAKEVRAALNGALVSSLHAASLRTEGDGPRLRVSAVVTAVDTANPAVNAISTLLLLAPVTRGGLTVEIEAVDASTGERIAALAYEGKAGIKDAMRAYSTLGHVAIEADRAAKRFVSVLAPPAAPAI